MDKRKKKAKGGALHPVKRGTRAPTGLSPGSVRRIGLVVGRSGKLARDWLRGIMRFAHEYRNAIVRIFEVGHGRKSEALLDFGGEHLDAVVVCDAPARYVKRVLARCGMADVPMAVFPQVPVVDAYALTVDIDWHAIAREAVDLFLNRRCASLAFFGAHEPRKRRMSRAVRAAFEQEAAARGKTVNVLTRRISNSVFTRASELKSIQSWLGGLPKPCGVLACSDVLAKDVIDASRLMGLNVPEAVQVLGLDNDDLICETETPSISSIGLDYEGTAYRMAVEMERRLCGEAADGRQPMVCGVLGVVERGSTFSAKGACYVVARALKYILENFGSNPDLGNRQVAEGIGVGVRTLEMRFKEATGGTVADRIRRIRLQRVCYWLKTTNSPLNRISSAAGFKSPTTLQLLFRRTYGMSMSEWRKRKRAKSQP